LRLVSRRQNHLDSTAVPRSRRRSSLTEEMRF